MKAFGTAIVASLFALASQSVRAETLDRYTGFFELSPKLILTVTREGDHLAVQGTHQPKLTLTGDGAEFVVQGVAASISFQFGASDDVTGLILHQAGRDIPAPRIDAATAERLQAPAAPVARNWPVLSGITIREITHDDAADYWPAFSPDGKTVVFSRTHDGKQWELWQVSATGGIAHPLAKTALPVSATRPAWSAQTNRIAFTGSSDGRDAVWTINPDGTGAQDMKAAGLAARVFYPSWSRNGKSLVVVAHQPQTLQQVDIATGAVTTLTKEAEILPGMPSVSPDGKWIVFAGQKNTGHVYDQNQNTLWLLDDHQALRALESPPLQGRAPVWSPDGRWIAFESDRGSPDGRYAVFFVRRDGSGLTQVTDYALNANHPVWSQDGRHLVVTMGLASITHIAVIDLPALGE